MSIYQLWRVGAGCEGWQDGDHEQRGPNVDRVGPKVLPADVPVQAACNSAPTQRCTSAYCSRPIEILHCSHILGIEMALQDQ